MKPIINGMTGEIENVYSAEFVEPIKKLSKNQKKKLKIGN